ncbi:ATP/GTP-binding protein [Tothia fuscella]|uniref:ATP/GTP-binding protein n=1 Tax=Tothia fuscella TaxID=1048955 RepID=A0A9P4NMS7_9PEZI|nr:ATP/GTP-binding protein [Tothia fuscella]
MAIIISDGTWRQFLVHTQRKSELEICDFVYTMNKVKGGDLVEVLIPYLLRTKDDPRPVVLMTSGIAGAGKSTLSKAVISKLPSFTRLSIDGYVHSKYGLYAIDYPREKYAEYLAEAQKAMRQQLREIIGAKDGGDVVLDSTLAFKEDRDDWARVVREGGGRRVLVYLDAKKEILWKRIQERQAIERNADSAFEMTEAILDSYLRGFEVPRGEGEVVLRIT